MSILPRRNGHNGPGRRRDRYAVGFLALCVLCFLVGCRGDAPDNDPAAPTITLAAAAPTATAAPVSVVVSTPTGAPTKTPLRPTLTPTPCAFTVLPDLALAYLDIELGCPINAGQEGVATAYAPFAGGQMIWRGDNGVIYVLTNDGRWSQYDDLWREGDAEFTCGEPASPPTPKRGFGRVWCDHPDVRRALGATTAAEIGDAGGRVQDFVNGMLLTAPDGSTFILAGETATWRRVWPGE